MSQRAMVYAFIWVLPFLLITGCTKRYSPAIQLDPSPKTIPITAEIHPFTESSEMKVPGRPYGVVASGVESAMPGQLAGPITNAVMEDFRTNHVVEQIDTYLEHPDVVMTGMITKFYESYKPKVWATLPGAKTVAKLIQADTYSSKAEAELRLVVLNTSGEVVGTYRGYGTTTDDFVPNEHHPPGARLNWALGEAVRQVREALLQDENIVKLAKARGTREKVTESSTGQVEMQQNSGIPIDSAVAGPPHF